MWSSDLATSPIGLQHPNNDQPTPTVQQITTYSIPNSQTPSTHTTTTVSIPNVTAPIHQLGHSTQTMTILHPQFSNRLQITTYSIPNSQTPSTHTTTTASNIVIRSTFRMRQSGYVTAPHHQLGHSTQTMPSLHPQQFSNSSSRINQL